MNYIVAFLLGIGLAVWVAQSRDEAEKYNASRRQEISTWEAMFLNYHIETP
jgi:hypothetical protein